MRLYIANHKTTATYALAAALVIFSGALVYFTFTLARIAVALPPIIAEFQVAQDKMEPIVDEVQGIRLIIPDVLDEISRIEERIPEIVAEVEAVRLSVPGILDEATAYREQIPAILAETEQIRDALPPILEEVAAYREEIPGIVAQVEGIQEQIPLILDQVEAIQTQIPLILAQVEAIRAEIPEHLDQAERITMNLEDIGQKAGEGAVTGVFTGLIRAPIRMVSSVGGTVLGGPSLSDSDRAILTQAVDDLIEGASVGDAKSFQNRETNVRGTVTILSIDQRGEQKCMTFHLLARRGRTTIHDQPFVLCQLADGSWELVEQ